MATNKTVGKEIVGMEKASPLWIRLLFMLLLKL